MQVASLIIGGLLLAFGRRLFWLFVAAAGFMAGVTLAGSLFPDNNSAVLIAGLVLGALAAVLAMSVQRIAVLAAGFFAGGYLLSKLVALLLASPDASTWLVFLIGGILGAVLLTMLFNWALVVLSSLTGAVMIAQSVALSQGVSLLLIAGLTILGIIIQAGVFRR